MKKSTKQLATLSLLIALAMILSYVESLLPVFVPVPGVKLGLSNIATVFALYSLGPVSAITVSLIRVFLSSLLFGNSMALIFSLSGAVLALLFMIPLSRFSAFSSIGVSVAGGVAHNAGQIIAAVLVLENAKISYFLAPLIISGTVSGIAIGIAAGILLNRIKRYISFK